jgi:anti-anti-sigma regulatory factor
MRQGRNRPNRVLGWNRSAERDARMQQEEVRLERLGSIAIVDLRGYITKTSGKPVKDVFNGIDPRVDRSVLFRFDEETYVNSEGIKTLIDLLIQARRNGLKVGITGISEHFKKIFRMVGITKLSRIFESTEEAIQEWGETAGSSK